MYWEVSQYSVSYTLSIYSYIFRYDIIIYLYLYVKVAVLIIQFWGGKIVLKLVFPNFPSRFGTLIDIADFSIEWNYRKDFMFNFMGLWMIGRIQNKGTKPIKVYLSSKITDFRSVKGPLLSWDIGSPLIYDIFFVGFNPNLCSLILEPLT